jgi:hypothetical protein
MMQLFIEKKWKVFLEYEIYFLSQNKTIHCTKSVCDRWEKFKAIHRYSSLKVRKKNINFNS